MKFTKFGKTLLMIAISAGIMLGITSCVQSYSVGYLYVTGTNNAASSNNGIISGFKIDHNKGKLTPINGLPVASGGANPGRAVLLSGGRFVYVLNRGKNSSGTANCTAADPCLGANIAEFAVGGNGVLSPQGQAFYPQGINPIRIFTDTSGNFLYTLDQIAPDNTSCALALGSGVTTCGDITAFKVDSNTGRLTLIVNAQVTSASGQALPYFPVPANPIDFTLSSSYIITLSGTPATGDTVFPYTYSAASGQLTVNQNSSQPLNIKQATAIVSAGGFAYVLDNESGTYNANGSTVTAPGWIFPFSVGTNGALQQESGGAVPDDVSLSNPVYLVLESKGKWIYVVNQGNNTNPNNSQSGIAGYVIDPATHYPTEISGSPFGTGSGPQCILEDPSNQFIYTANFNDSTVTGRVVDQNSGVLNDLPGSANKSYALEGPAAWCIVTGRTS
jgi:hypothetical protein